MNLLVIIALLMFCIVVSVNASLRDEPQCYSRFDYEYKVVQKLFMLENAYNEQFEIIKALRTEISSIKQTGQERKEEIEDMKAVLQDTNNRNKAVMSTVDSMKNISVGNRGEIVAFSACLDHNLSNIQGEQIIIFNHVILNMAGGYDETTGIFLCPQDGVYLFSFFIGVRGDQQFFVRLMVNNNPRIEAAAQGKHTKQDLQGGNSVIIELHKGYKVWVQQYTGTVLETMTGAFRMSSYSGVLLYPLDQK